jgi:isovaleryl-CoA dehydrogenase
MADLFNPTEEHAALRALVREFTEREVDPQAAQHDRDERFNLALFRRLGDLGVLGITVPTEYGGAGMDAVAAVIVHEELASADPGLTLAYLAHAMLFANNVARNASPAQCARILPAACRGERIGGMCMSEPSAGTDVLGMQTTARRRGDEYVLSGTKMWITNGAVAEGELGDVFLVYARMAGAKSSELTQFIVEKGAPGFVLGQRIHGKLGMRASGTAELVFDDCRVPAHNLIGREGHARLHMMRNLEIERLTLAAISLGIARRSVEVMTRYAKERRAFGKPINQFGQIQRYVADSYAEFMAGRAYVYQTAGTLDLEGHGQRVHSDGVKLYCASMAKRVADRAIQVLGGYGYVGEYQVERLWRDAKLIEIGGGTLEAHQKNIAADLARGDGIIR